MARTIYVGQRVPVEGEFRLRGVPTDPVVVRCLVRPPAGGLIQLVYPDESLVRTDIGRYEAAVEVDAAGTWTVRWEGAGIIDAVDEIAIPVAPSVIIQ